MRLRTGVVMLATAFALAAVLAQGASAGNPATKCPSEGTPPQGTTVSGGLEVDGFCVLEGVTVTGGVYVDPTLDTSIFNNWNLLDLIGSTVRGGVVVANGSELDTSIDESTFSVTSQPSTIVGGITLDRAIFAILANAIVQGGITSDGVTETPAFSVPGFCGDGGGDPPCWNNDAYCGLTIHGNVMERNLDFTQSFLGDPHEEGFFANSDCAANTIHGSVFLENSNFRRPTDGEPSEIEGETVTGSVHLDHSIAEVNENTIGGSLLCTNGSEIHPPAGPDIGGNTVRGKDTCD